MKKFLDAHKIFATCNSSDYQLLKETRFSAHERRRKGRGIKAEFSFVARPNRVASPLMGYVDRRAKARQRNRLFPILSNSFYLMNRQQLIDNIHRKQSFLCVGLDPDVSKMPAHLQACEDGLFLFNRAIIDATAPYCVAYKPNLAFYECHGLRGWQAFEQTVAYIQEHYPDQFVIADAKRGDIGNTSTMYARRLFVDSHVDAITVAPYMGEDSVAPFLTYEGKWAILLALTSNKGSHDFQLMEDVNGERLFERVLRHSQQWGTEENMMYVVGATQGIRFADIRKIVPRHFLLVPGVGAQGGSLAEVCRYGMTTDCGLLVNSSRGIIHADASERFAAVAQEKAQELQSEMATMLATYIPNF